MSEDRGARWSRQIKIDTDGTATERIRKEYVESGDGTIQGDLAIEKNRCAKHILEAIELTYGKNSRHWTNVRRIVLRSINDYHRSVLKSIQKLEEDDE